MSYLLSDTVYRHMASSSSVRSCELTVSRANRACAHSSTVVIVQCGVWVQLRNLPSGSVELVKAEINKR